jgi:hypothetical protein
VLQDGRVYTIASLAAANHVTKNTIDPAITAPQTQPGAPPSVRNTDLLSLLKFRQSTPTYHSNAPDTSSANSHTSDLSQPRRSPSAQRPATCESEIQEDVLITTSPPSFLLKLLKQTPKGKAAPAMKTHSVEHESQVPMAATARAHTSPDVNSAANVAPFRSTNGIHHESVSDAVTGVEAEVQKQLASALTTANPPERLANPPADKVSSNSTDANARGNISGRVNGGVVANDLTTDEWDISRGAKTDPSAQQEIGDASWLEVMEGNATTFTLPMQPFKAIRIGELGKHPALLPPSMTMDIARVRRPFDQIDRNLVTATPNLMVYPLKNGGLRTIRQQTGAHKEVFKQIPERIFNVIASTRRSSNGENTELILGTGVKGSIFWASLAAFAASDDVNLSSKDGLHSFVFPPVAPGDEVTSGGQLKSRVKPSSRHPEFFGYSRGKAIYLIYPRVACSQAYYDPTTQVCKSDKYIKEHMLRVSTGKAGKDFIFSADDSLIISLDKAGRLKFWDIRHLTQEHHAKSSTAAAPLDIKLPVMTLATCPNTVKSWPTSIHLVDKEKPMTKGIALRYLIVGLEQNHTLQLWDLTLGKPVQEISFPHDQDTDAICSIVFHAKTGIVTVAHPTRNSIYFLHLSIPPYTMPPMNQAKFVSLVAEKDNRLSPPQSTIIVNGLREFKFHQQAIVRSIDVLAEPGSQYGEDQPAFVLYAMHSNGITEIKVDRDMLGLAENNRLMNGISALEVKDAIHVSNMKALPNALAGDAIAVTSEAPSEMPTSSFEGSTQSTKSTKSSQHRAERLPSSSLNLKVNTPEKRNSKERTSHDCCSTSRNPLATISISPTKSTIATHNVDDERDTVVEEETPQSGSMPSSTISEAFHGASKGRATVSHSLANANLGQVESLLKAGFELLQENLRQDRLDQDLLANARQEAVLKTVSRTLAENVEDSLSRIVTHGLVKITTGSLKDVVASVLERQFTSSSQDVMRAVIPHELNQVLPTAFSSAFKDTSVVGVLSEQVAANVTDQIDRQFEANVRTILAPEIKTLLDTTMKPMLSELSQISLSSVDRLRDVDIQVHEHLARFDALHSAITKLQAAITDLASSQQKHHSEILAILQQHTTVGPESASVVTSTHALPAVEQILSPIEFERIQIHDALMQRQHEEATLKVRFGQLFCHSLVVFVAERRTLIPRDIVDAFGP